MPLLSRLLCRLLEAYFSKVPVPQSLAEIRDLDTPSLVVSQSKALIYQALLNSLAKRAGYTGLAYGQHDPEQRRLGWVCLHDSAALMTLSSGTSMGFSTFNIIRGRGPIRTNPTHRIGWSRLLGLLLSARFTHIIFGSPIVIDRQDPLSVPRLQRRLRVDFFRHLKAARGTPLQPIEQQARIVLSGPEFERELSIISARQNISSAKVRRLVLAEFFDIAANPKSFVYMLGSPIARFIISRLFSQVSTQGLKELEPSIREATVILVPMHRSHLDYILVGYELYRANLNPPLVAAGINLRFWPVGYIIRSLGAYFVKRNARHDRIHSLVLRRYVAYLTNRGHLQEFFIEGGRSRSGKMRPPKIGILNVMVSSFLSGLRREILFVPVALTYEKVIEDKAYGDENTGKGKPKESLKSLLNLPKVFRSKHGEAILRFGQPLSLSTFADSQKANSSDDRALVQELAHEITRRIRDQSGLSLSALAYSALMFAPRYTLERSELIREIKRLNQIADYLKQFGLHSGQATSSLASFLAGNSGLIDQLENSGIVSRNKFLNQDIWVIRGSKRFTADFYRNSLSHIFFPVALLNCLELLDRPLEAESAEDLHALFAGEYLLPAWTVYKAELNKLIEKLKALKIILPQAGKLKFDPGRSFFTPMALLASIQSMLWVIEHLKSKSVVQSSPDQGDSPRLDYASSLKQLQSEFRAAIDLGLVSRTEAASKANLTSAFENLARIKGISITEQSGSPIEIIIQRDLEPERRLLNKLNQLIS